ncbi:hypothetical protein ROLI_043160 [Roseobacter fucihabitans]|uniref:Uncharacterized protein n=1 Tax=Roseobacter fucihabitans TaxID=1537242 RepID=A0ABZ2BYQ5_9RHOB|nr:hypothetical protein [Roseobacter litoralis]MBC6964121.1 hypothetical protein [Roseobacter litoralis]
MNGAPFTEMPPFRHLFLWKRACRAPDTFRRLQNHMLRKEGGDREMVDILSLVLHHDESAVLRAVELALEAGVPTKTHILNPLHRLIDPKQTDHPEIDPPPSRQIALQSPVGQWMLLHWKPPQRQMWIAMTTSDRQEASAMRHDPAGASIIIMLRSLKLRLAKGEHL